MDLILLQNVLESADSPKAETGSPFVDQSVPILLSVVVPDWVASSSINSGEYRCMTGHAALVSTRTQIISPLDPVDHDHP